VIHNTDVKGHSTGRSYASPLREAQAGRTRQQILEALIRTMSRGVAEVSIPAVAQEAGVSIPTVYRHFGSKRGLFAALNPYVVDKAGLRPDGPIDNLDQLLPKAKQIFRRGERLDATLRAAMATELGQQARRSGIPERREAWRHAIRGTAPDLAHADLERLTDLAVIFFSSAMLRAFKDYLGVGADDAADRVSWALRLMVEAAQRNGSRSDPGEGGS
jgi:AcrR family transcriptional regulator